jgi:hypothetical protein
MSSMCSMPTLTRIISCVTPLAVCGAGVRVEGVVLVEGLGFETQGAGCKVYGVGCRISRVWI